MKPRLSCVNVSFQSIQLHRKRLRIYGNDQNVLVLYIIPSTMWPATVNNNSNNIMGSNNRGVVGDIYRQLYRLWVSCAPATTCHDDVTAWKSLRITSPLWGESNGKQRIPIAMDQLCKAWMYFFVDRLNKLSNRHSSFTSNVRSHIKRTHAVW